jgi:hypothetical protein
VRRHILDATRRDVWDFWVEHTRASPLRRDNASSVAALNKDGQMVRHSLKHIQTMSDRAMYELWCTDNGPSVSFSVFCRVGYCKPGFMRRMAMH